ncbi:MAG: hypothetical protein MK212_16650 [Saprospiraceae bacterium]|nr:hypothetical protein [Saprospiraceae bacterium]
MKKILFLAMILGVAFASCKKDPVIDPEPEPEPVVTATFSLSAETVSGSGSATDNEIITAVSFTNNSTIDGASEYVWEIDDTTLPTGWQASICDNVQCWSPDRTDNTISVNKDDSFDLKVHFYPNNIDGSGTVNVKVYATSDSAGTAKTIVYTASTGK